MIVLSFLIFLSSINGPGRPVMAGGYNGSLGDNSSLYGYDGGILCDPGPNDSTLCNLTVPLADVNGTDAGPLVSYELWQIIFLAILAGTTSIMTILGNLVVIISFIVERSVRQPTNYFIASLAVSDLLIGKYQCSPLFARPRSGSTNLSGNRTNISTLYRSM